MGEVFQFLNLSFWSNINITELEFSKPSCVYNLPKIVNTVKSTETILDNQKRSEKIKQIIDFVLKRDNTELHINPTDFEIVCDRIADCAILEPVPKSSSPDTIIHIKLKGSIIMNLGFQNKSSQVINTKLIAKEVLTFMPPRATYYHTLVIVGFGGVDLPNDNKNFIQIPSKTILNVVDSIYIPPGSTITYEQNPDKKVKIVEEIDVKTVSKEKKRKSEPNTNKRKKVLKYQTIPNNMEVIILLTAGVQAFFY